MNSIPEQSSRRRRVLWIPHTAWSECEAQRPRILADALKDRYELHVLTWEMRPADDRSGKWFYVNPTNHLRAFRRRSYFDGEQGYHVHSAGVPLPVVAGILSSYPPHWALLPSQIRFQAAIRRLHRTWQFDAAFVAASHHFTGLPPAIPGLPVIFDYLDMHPEFVEAEYVKLATRIVSVSKHLQDLVAARYGRKSRWIPNGVNLDRIQKADRNRGRRKWGWEGKKVVSLIGLTCSPRLYFIEALAALMAEFPQLMFVAAGQGRIAELIEARCRELGVPVLMTGWVSPIEVPDLFAASDVGLYPGDDTPYFDGACPLKVLEYTCARVPVVTNRAAELSRLGFPNLLVREATTEAFVSGLREALTTPPVEFPNMASFAWPKLAEAVSEEIELAMKQPSNRPKCQFQEIR